MKSLKTKIAIVLVVIMGCCAQPIYAQAWKKTAAKEATQVAKKVFKKQGAKQAQKAAQKGASKAGSSVSSSATRAGAAATQHVHEVTCSGCSGNGFVYYNGYRYTCSQCGGKGKIIVYN